MTFLMRTIFSQCSLLALVIFLTLVSCAPEPVYKNTFVAAGTFLEVTSSYKEAAAVVEAEFRRLEKLFNGYDAASELSRLNQSRDTLLSVSPEMIEILTISQRIYDMTDGAFDISCGRLYRFWKEEIAKGGGRSLPPQEVIAALQDQCGMQYIEIDSDANTARITNKEVEIDLGAIAKGYMIDKAIERLKEEGITSALVNAGGDLYSLGKNKKQPWHVGIRNPRTKNGAITSRYFSDKAIATSGNYEQFFEVDGRRFSHIIDPRSGYPVSSDIVSVTIIAERCAFADALATACFAVGSGAVEKLLERAGPVEAIVIREEDGKEIVRVFEHETNNR